MMNRAKGRLRAGLYGLLAVALCSCNSNIADGLDFPFNGDETKSDVFGRSLVGRASPYEPDLSLGTEENTLRLRSDMKFRRDVAWATVFKVLEPVPLLGLAEVSQEHPEVELPNGVPEIPRFQTWYGIEDAKRMFQRVYEQLGPAGRRARSPVTDEIMQEAIAFSDSAVERSDRWPLDRYLQHIKDLELCPPSVTPEECALTLSEKNGGAASGTSRIVYSPGTIEHVITNYSSILDCLSRLESLPMEEQPASEDNFSVCFSDEFPPDAALVKAQWVRADFGTELPAFDTDADALRARMAAGALWPDDGDRKRKPSSKEAYTIRLKNGNTFRLAGLHIMTKETRHWQWITLWWSDKPDVDFGEDRPAAIRDLPPVWSNYKMCAVSWFDEQDPELATRYASLPTLDAAIEATGGAVGEPSWCSNPYLEHGHNNAQTNCIGCHQHGGSRVAFDLDGDGALDPLDLETVIQNETLYPNHGRSQIRELFPSDYLYAFNRVDDLAGMIFTEVQFFDSTDKDEIAGRISSILGLTGNPGRGSSLFSATCAACHGANGLGTSVAPSLAERVPARSDDGLLQSILRGRGDMPAWESNFADQDFADLLAHLRATF